MKKIIKKIIVLFVAIICMINYNVKNVFALDNWSDISSYIEKNMVGHGYGTGDYSDEKNWSCAGFVAHALYYAYYKKGGYSQFSDIGTACENTARATPLKAYLDSKTKSSDGNLTVVYDDPKGFDGCGLITKNDSATNNTVAACRTKRLRDKLQAGDIIIFYTGNSDVMAHAAIVATAGEDPLLYHALSYEKGSIKKELLNYTYSDGQKEPYGAIIYRIGAEKKYGHIKIKKVDENGQPLQGVRFNIYNSHSDAINLTANNMIYSGVTDQNGEIFYGKGSPKDTLLGGSEYYIREISTVGDYKIKTYTYYAKVSNSGGETTITVENKKETKFKVVKKDENNNLLSGSEFILRSTSSGSDGVSAIKIKGNGEAVDVKPGTYTLSESVVPEGYLKMADKQITIPATSTTGNPYIDGNVTVFTATNTPIKTKFYKKDNDSDTKDKLVAGFQIKTSNNQVVHFSRNPDSEGCYVVDNSSNDTITEIFTTTDKATCLSKLTAGATYTIEETNVPEGYLKMNPKSITIGPNTDPTVLETELGEDRIKTRFYKKDEETGDPLEAGFEIFNNNQIVHFSKNLDSENCYVVDNSGNDTITTVYTKKSINDGVACLSKVTAGATYTIKEKEDKVPEGYQKANDMTITIGPNDDTAQKLPAAITEKPLKIIWYKEDSETHTRLTGAGFNVYNQQTGNAVALKSEKDHGCYVIDRNSDGTEKVGTDGTTNYTETDNNGEVCIKNVTKNTTYRAVETKIPEGYKKMPDFEITSTSNTDTNGYVEDTKLETPLYMYFNKIDGETNAPLNNVGFNVYKNNKLVKFTKKDTDDCYLEDASGNIEKLVTKDITINSTKEDGSVETKSIKAGVCIKYVTANTDYKILETELVDGYTFFKPQETESGILINVNDVTNTQTIKNLDGTIRNNSTFINYPTKLDFVKKVNDDATNDDNTITSLIDIAKFTITKKGDNPPLKFTDKGNGEYWYDKNGSITLLHTTNRKFNIKYLPWGEYTVNEAEYTLTETEKQVVFKNSGTWYTNEKIKGVPGYYYNSTKEAFDITKYNNGVIDGMDSSNANIVNKLVQINFEKTDIYKYYTADDKAKIDSDEKLLDTAKFVLKDKNGNVLRLKKISNEVYRYLPFDDNNTVEQINTYNGKLIITHLMNNTSYTIEEVSSPEGFILPDDHPKKTYNIKEEQPENENDDSITNVTENTPTRIKIEKRDLKTGKLIEDKEYKTTFELYKKESDGSLTRIYVTEKTLIPDALGNMEYAYRYSKLNAKTDVKIHITNGYIVFRYLPKGSYVLKEIEAPKGYDLPVGEKAETYFEVSGTTIEADTEVVKNKPSRLIIRKYSQDGSLITGARFRVYKITNYDKNLSAENNVITSGQLLAFKTIRDGEYENKEVRDTTDITTCIENCSEIGKETNDSGIIKSGELLVEYLETESWYVIEETKAPEGYSLPDDPYVLVYLPESTEDKDIDVSIENNYTPITFYKYDEYNKLLDGGEYKLQKLNKQKKYEDVFVSKLEEKEGSVYTIDYNSNNTTITTTNGQATIYLLTEGQYRVLETKAPEGYVLPKASINVSTFFVTDDGKVRGDFIITNKKPTQPNIKLNKADSELVLSVQTGQTVIRYTLIIVGLLIVIGILMFIIKKMNK